MEINLVLMAIGRTVFGLFFVIAGLRNFSGYKTWLTRPTNYGWPMPAPLLALGFALQLVTGLCLVANIAVVPAVIALIVFLIGATALFHNPLMFPASDRALHIYLVLVNITLAAGLLMVMSASL